MSERSQDPVQLTSRVVLEGLAYPECPRWHDGLLYFSDQYAGNVIALDANGVATTVAEVPGRPSGLGWMPDGDMLVVSMLEHRVYRCSDGALRVHAELRDQHPGPSNDMVVDSRGRAYVGNIGFDFYGGEQPRTTALVLVDPDGSVRTVADELLVPNGMALLADESELVVAESFAHRLTAFTIQPDGALTDRRCYADLDGQIPDGISKDPAGGIWFAAVDTTSCLRADREGRVTHRVDTADRHVFACEVGGPAGSTLYLCTSRSHQPDEAVALLSGAIECVELPAECLTHM